jgi:hypothetical protein
LRLTLALPPGAAWRLRLREFAWVNEFRPPWQFGVGANSSMPE